MAIIPIDQSEDTKASSAAPTDEIGAVLMAGMRMTRENQAWATLIDEFEYVPEITWPNSVRLYDQMRSDTQLAALYQATTLTIENWKWSIDPNGADEPLVRRISQDYNLPILGEDPRPIGRQKDRFTFHKHLHLALRALIYGHAAFEQVGRIGDDGLWHIRKLAERPQRHIARFTVAPDGGLVSIHQDIINGARPRSFYLDLPEIPIDRLLMYVWEQEGGNWFGRSIFRECYKNWLIKDRLMRVDAINHEKAGGVPIGIAAPGSTPSDINAMAQAAAEFKVGEHSGAGLPPGSDMKILRAAGSDVVGSMRYHDESMARRFLLMVMQLGQTQSGSRALGTTFVDFFSRGLEAVGIWARDTFNEYQIEDDVDWNEGEGTEFVPRLHFEHDPDLDFEVLGKMVDSKIIQVDDDLEDAVRKELGATRRGTPRLSLEQQLEQERAEAAAEAAAQNPGEPESTTQANRGPGRAVTAEGAPSLLPDRPLRRQPYDHEITAATDWATLDQQWQTAVDLLVGEWGAVQAAQADELRDAIIEADGNVKKLSKISATPRGATLILSRLQQLASQGAEEATKEAKRQGVSAETPETEALQKRLLARAEAVETLLADSLSQSAKAKAIQLSGGGMSPSDVAEQVRGHLGQLTTTYLHDQLGGALQAAQNAGRKLAMKENGAVKLYASELLDGNTCDRCIAVDGREYGEDLNAAEQDYPTGGFKDCRGGPRCRGTLVAIYDVEEV